MKKMIIIFLAISMSFAFNLFDLGFTKNFFEIKKGKPVNILNIKYLNFKYIEYQNKNKSFFIKLNKNVKVFTIEQLNKILLRNGYPLILKVIKETSNKIFVKIVPADILNKYDVTGIRLNKNYHIKDIIKYLNQNYYTQIVYNGENFIVPKNPNIVIKNITELKKYLDAVNNKSIIFVSSVDINNDNLPEFLKYKEIINKIKKGLTPLKQIIEHLTYSIQLAKKVDNPNFQKKLFIEDLKQTITQLKELEN